MSDSLRRIVITGSESTGKTTLARELADAHDTFWVPEFARTYAESHTRALVASDVEPIARGQLQSEDDGERRARTLGRALLLLDTDLVSTTVYARHYYGTCPPWIEEAAAARLAPLYLLCDIDLPWIADAARDQPMARAQIHAKFVDALDRLGARYEIVRGVGDARLASAQAIIARATG